MDFSKMVSCASAVFLGLGLASGSVAVQAGKGSAEALAVCQAVAQDRSSEVARLLSEHRVAFDYSYANLTPNRRGLSDTRDLYECNGLSLDEFAKRVGADKTAALLEGGQLMDDEYVAETREGKSDPNS